MWYQWLQRYLNRNISLRTAQAFPPSCLQTMVAELQQSPFLQKNILNQRFASTLGFSVLFRDPQRAVADFPWLDAFIEQMAQQRFNFYYLNALVLHEASQVERHIDHSIRGYGTSLPFPRRVTVLYLQIPPDMQGGRLLLYDSRNQIIERIVPETGLLLHLKGSQKHAVEAVSQSAHARISLVCEQYRLSDKQLKCLPEYTVKSTAGFDAFLQKQFEKGAG